MRATELFVKNDVSSKLQKDYNLFTRWIQYIMIGFALASPQDLQANFEMANPLSCIESNSPSPTALDADSKANIESAIEFLRDWGLINEANNIQKWLDDKKIDLDLNISGAETSTTNGNIKLDGLLLLGGGKESKNLQHKFNPANRKDKERIAELAFTLVHEKVHAHQSYISFVYNREGNEADAYNKEITDADNTLNKMDAELNKAINNGDKAKEKELLEWISAVLQVKINAIETFDNEYPKSRKLSWPDRVLEDLKKLKKINDDKLKQFSMSNTSSDEANAAFKTLLGELNRYENSLPAKQMPAYWIKANANTDPYVDIKINEDFQTIVFKTIQGKVTVYLPSDMRTGDMISGSIGTQTTGNSEDQTLNQTEINGYVIEVNKQKTNVNKKNFMQLIPAAAISEGFVISLINKKGTEIGTTIVPFNTTFPNTAPTAATNNFQLPSLGLQGDPIKITGPFDGNHDNTNCTIGGQQVDIIAESPRQMNIISPANVKGPTILTLKEGNIEKSINYRSVGLKLSASKMTLLKGERTTLTVQVDGLQNLQNKIFLRLESKGTVSMKGGNLQFLEIHPKDIQPAGSWIKTQTLVGLQNGGFQVTASVVDKIP